MIQEIAKFRWPRFTGKAQWVQCFAHILNLIVQVILQPFGSHKAQKDINCHDAESNSNSNEGSDSYPEDPQNLIQMYNEDKYNSEDEDTEYHTAMDKNIADELIDDKELELETEDINDLSDKADDDIYTTKSCQETLAKFREIVWKLKKSPTSKTLFVEICRENICSRPHMIERNICKRWNSTLVQLLSIQQCSKAILEWQKDKRHGNR
ncbi:hypothetical protein PTTG_25747 [Puccinia triticina 1-1 BBBD Race 1]|uniref:hAT-like transposase RNase-H fold domain-containing protein n=1 Tax=Puccinia triticina (isolate 1-1 / race 1 (BBBD)) TaxID=630390 RepID=A0A180H0K5_PUCT1|nr:hypothetical protein PTTG_25747 [Puccinia triticina 1-1 BBBD Race 1]